MKAIVYDRYGTTDVLDLKEMETPALEDKEVLIRVCAASVNPYDWHFLRGKPFCVRVYSGLRKPKIPQLGVDVAGVVEAVGSGVTEFKPGDEVFGTCDGALAEYARASESALVLKPKNLTFEQAAAIPVAGSTALQAVRDYGQTQAGQQVLINGAAGGVGTFAVQIAKALGADVTAVCSTRNVEMVRSLGADRVIDYTRENFTKNGRRYDVMLDSIGNHPLRACARVLNPEGLYVLYGAVKRPLTRLLKANLLFRFLSQNLATFLTKGSKDDLTFLLQLIEAGKLTPVIDRCYPLGEVPQALRYLGEGHARGKVVIAV